MLTQLLFLLTMSLSRTGSVDLEARDLGQCLAVPITNRETLDKSF